MIGLVLLIFKFSNFTDWNQSRPEEAKNRHSNSETATQIEVTRLEIPLKTPSELIGALRKAVLEKDKASIDRAFQLILHMGGDCIIALQTALIKEADIDVAKMMSDVLVGIGTPQAYQAVLEAAMLSENKDTKYAVLDRLKTTISEEGNRTFINLALTGKGDLQEIAADFITSSGKPDLLSGLVNTATPEQRDVVAKILANSLSPSVAEVLQECVNLPDETLAKAAISGLARQSSEQSLKLLLSSISTATPNPVRFQDVVNGVGTMLTQNPNQQGLPILLEALATTSPSNTTRAAAIQILSNSNQVSQIELYQMLNKYKSYETDPQVIPYLQKALAKFSSNSSQPVSIITLPSNP